MPVLGGGGVCLIGSACNSPNPFLSFPPRAAWIALGDLSKEEAKDAFRAILEERVEGFQPWMTARLQEKAEQERRERERQARERREREAREREELERRRLEQLHREQEARRADAERQRQAHASVHDEAAAEGGATAVSGEDFDLTTAGRLPKSQLTDPKFIESFRNALSGNPESEAVVGSGETLTVRVPMPSRRRTQILWQFTTDQRDIAFGVDFERKNPDNSVQVEPVLRSSRLNAHLEVVTGVHVSEHEGTWLLKFDNTYSYFRGKTVFYRVLCSEV